jgi:hypothetical protein
MYPAPATFYLGHELGHIALGHVTGGRSVVDLDPEPTEAASASDNEEGAADEFSLELLTGSSHPTVLRDPKGARASARGLARAVLESAASLKIEPGVLAQCYGYSTGEWKIAAGSLKHIYSEGRAVWKEVNRIAWRYLSAGDLSTEGAEYLAAVMGVAPDED